MFLTGVTKFSKVSIFSDLNHLQDITIDEEFACICGITEQEIIDSLGGHIIKMAEKHGVSQAECFAELKKMYDGYHFHHNAQGVYNPFSLSKYSMRNMKRLCRSGHLKDIWRWLCICSVTSNPGFGLYWQIYNLLEKTLKNS